MLLKCDDIHASIDVTCLHSKLKYEVTLNCLLVDAVTHYLMTFKQEMNAQVVKTMLPVIKEMNQLITRV